LDDLLVDESTLNTGKNVNSGNSQTVTFSYKSKERTIEDMFLSAFVN
jgi:hypothetical protein